MSVETLTRTSEETRVEKINFKKAAVVIMGPPDVGKSTLAIALKKVSNIERVDIDIVRRKLEARTKYRSEQAAMEAAYRNMFVEAKRILQKGIPVVIAATFSGPHNFLEEFARASGVPIQPFVLEYPPEPEKRNKLLAERLAKRSEEPFSYSNVLTIDHAMSVIERFTVFQGFDGRPTMHLDASRDIDENLGLIIKSLSVYRI